MRPSPVEAFFRGYFALEAATLRTPAAPAWYCLMMPCHWPMGSGSHSMVAGTRFASVPNSRRA